jgi:hypothetical protein
MGGKTLSFHVTLGPFDYVAVVEAPSDEVSNMHDLGTLRNDRSGHATPALRVTRRVLSQVYESLEGDAS